MSLRTGKGALSLKNPTKAKLRAIGAIGNETQRAKAASTNAALRQLF